MIDVIYQELERAKVGLFKENNKSARGLKQH